MKTFTQHFNENEILRQICKIRVKMAKSKSKKHLLHLLTSNVKYNYHLKSSKTPNNEFEQYQSDLAHFLSTILPPRKDWVKLGQESRRKPNKTNEFLTSNDKNFYSLLKTIKIHKKKKSQEQWFLNLQSFTNEIIKLTSDSSYTVGKPIIIPKPKETLKKEGLNECRPICMFNLRDRIILSITNKFLTRLFDSHFQNSAFAFRAKKNDENKILSHHDCIKEIVKYRRENQDKTLYVVECDMKKFYDTVNHGIIKKLFNELIIKSKEKNHSLNLEAPTKIFESYLNCFAFNIDIPKPNNLEYWDSYKITNGEFSWITDVISEHYNDISQERIGIPQGGALSGLISNIYLNQADIELHGMNILYQRFCDDMIIISDNLNDCERAKEQYEKTLMKLKLFPHKFKEEKDLKASFTTRENNTFWEKFISTIKLFFNTIPLIKDFYKLHFQKKSNTKRSPKSSYQLFWQGKSKGPYRWGKIEDNCFPWIGFVGYEINHLGEIRVRKKSLEKELKKQKTIIKEIENAIKIGMRKPKGTATESAINRLIGMSVGRIGIDNFDEVSTDLCWKNGFKELTINKHSIRQIKQLDRNRSKQYYRLLKDSKEPKREVSEQKPRQVIKYNKPFSYYYQILERQKKQNKTTSD